jgi:hypothetical protein
MLKKRALFFQLVSTLFCEVKRGFVEPCKNEISRLFTSLFRPKCLQEQLKHTRSALDFYGWPLSAELHFHCRDFRGPFLTSPLAPRGKLHP